MADFYPPHGINNTTKRYPSHEEAQKGFDCGPADRDRFNGQLYRLEAELGELINWAGITPTNDRMTQVREAIQSKLTPFLKSINGDNDGGTLSGDLFSFLMSNGKKWDLNITSGFQSVAAYTSNFTWPVPAGVTRVLIIAIGGGGGGSGGRGSANPINSGGKSYVSGGGGGGAGVAIKFINTLVPGGTVPITIGVGGDGALYNPSGHSVGNAGGSTSFGPYVTARGGLGGQNQIGGTGGTTYGASIGWSLGAGGIGDINSGGSMKGGSGGGGMRATGSSRSTGASGANGSNGFGMGGAGSASGFGSASPTATSVRGGKGGSGRIMILY